MSRSDCPDAFLGGRLKLWQGAYRAGADPVFLAAAVPAKPGQSVLELGVGAGVALFCLSARVPDLGLYGLDIRPEAIELAQRNADENGIEATFVQGDVAAMPPALVERDFDHVMMNPPFFASGTLSEAAERRVARHETAGLGDWLDAGLRRLKPGGHLSLIHTVERLPDVLVVVSDRLGDIAVRPLAPRAGKEPKRMVLVGRKGARSPFRLRAPFVLHEGDSHTKDGDSYTKQATAILRGGAAFPD